MIPDPGWFFPKPTALLYLHSMKEQISNKLADLLKELPFTKEYQVSYLFLETRKLLDRVHRRNKYTYVRFFCDWVMHTEKTQNLEVISDDFSKIAADIESQTKKSIVQLILAGDRHPFAEFTSFEKLRTELSKLFSENNISGGLTGDDHNWFSLRNLLFRILADQPVDFGNRPIRNIKSIRFNEVKKDLYGCILIIEFIQEGILTKKRYIFADDHPNFKI